MGNAIAARNEFECDQLNEIATNKKAIDGGHVCKGCNRVEELGGSGLGVAAVPQEALGMVKAKSCSSRSFEVRSITGG